MTLALSGSGFSPAFAQIPPPLCSASLGPAKAALSENEAPLSGVLSIAKWVKRDPNLHMEPPLATARDRNEFLDAASDVEFISLGDRILMIGKNKAQLSQIMQNAADSKESDKKNILPDLITIKELPGYFGYDVTSADFMSPFVRDIHNVWARSGPNCWNLCQIYRGWAQTNFYTSANEFALWLSSPFAVKLDPGSEATSARGTVLVVRKINLNGPEPIEVHGAIVLTPDLVLTKNGTLPSQIYQISTLKNMLSNYVPGRGEIIEYYSIQDLAAIWPQAKLRISPQTEDFVEAWFAFERKHGQDISRGSDAPKSYKVPPVTFEEYRSLLQRFVGFAPARIKQLEDLGLVPKYGVELFFLKLLQLRIDNFFYYRSK